MSSIIKVDQIQLSDGSTPTTGDLGLNTTGAVLQVVQIQGSDTIINTSSYVSAISGSITPSSTSSKILIFVTTLVHKNATGSSGDYWSAALYRGTASETQLRIVHDATHFNASTDSGARVNVVGQYLDSPNTTSAQTYTLAGKRHSGSTDARFNQADSGQLTLIEIAG